VTSDLLIPRKTVWVVVADEASATVYARKSRVDPLVEVFSLENKAARMKMADLLSDRGGRSFDSHGPGRHTMAREMTGPKRHASVAFAKDLAQRIRKAMNEGVCDEVALICAPKFLGDLRDALSRAGNVVPTLTIDKDMTGHEIAAVESLLADY
jgi:protein required for attachment to host cells